MWYQLRGDGSSSSYVGPIGISNYVKMVHNGIGKSIVTTRIDEVPNPVVHILYTSVSNIF